MLKGPRPKSLRQRYLENLIVGDECWGWAGPKHPDGYGYLGIKRRSEGLHYNVYAHRLSWERTYGAIPDGLFVCHRCDNPECTNPAHLFLGTNADNMRDCSLKGRQNGTAKARPGEKNANAKLTSDQVRFIRSSAERNCVLTEKYGVSKSLICAIRKGRAWQSIL